LDILERSQTAKKQTKERGFVAPRSSNTALNTPPLTTMDSDDEFMSGLSSQDEDFGGAQDSDDGSLGDGTYSLDYTRHFRTIRLTNDRDERIR